MFFFLSSLNNLYAPNPNAPNPRNTPPVIPIAAIAPVAPNDWAIANPLPAATLPIPDCTPAATEPAAIPELVNPAKVIPPPTAAAVPPAVVAAIDALLMIFSLDVSLLFSLLLF